MKQFFFAAVGFAIVSALLFAPGQAIGLAYYGIEDTITDDLNVQHKITLQFDTPISRLDYALGFRVADLRVEKNFDAADCSAAEQGEGSVISCTFVGMTPERNQLKLIFTTRDNVRDVNGYYQYAVNYGISLPVESAFTLIRLPKNGILAFDVANASYAPDDGKVLTDGKHIMVFWNIANLSSGNNLQYRVDFGLPVLDPGTGVLILAGIAGAVVVVLGGLFVYSRRRVPAPAGPTPTEIIASVLNLDEKRVVDIVAAAGGRVGQKVIVRESGFSKAKVSRLVKAMKARNIVDTEPVSGRENRVFLRTGQAEQQATKKEEKGENPETEQ